MLGTFYSSNFPQKCFTTLDKDRCSDAIILHTWCPLKDHTYLNKPETSIFRFKNVSLFSGYQELKDLSLQLYCRMIFAGDILTLFRTASRNNCKYFSKITEVYIYVYVYIYKTMCPPVYQHIGFVATHA